MLGIWTDNTPLQGCVPPRTPDKFVPDVQRERPAGVIILNGKDDRYKRGRRISVVARENQVHLNRLGHF